MMPAIRMLVAYRTKNGSTPALTSRGGNFRDREQIRAWALSVADELLRSGASSTSV